jgi:hypothetical protein
MTRDPFYQQILAGLRGQLDPELFERCAAGLLRRIYAGLVPIRGGSDAGMDGACTDGAGPGFPLVCTTGEDVIGNLNQSLRSYRSKGDTRDRAILATSQELTGTRRRNLEAAAGELGFILVGIHTQANFADLLYRDPAWCLELLGLTGNPPPLSALPLNNRPALTSSLIGREEDLAWLRATPGDLLLVGQPGAGKTSVLSVLAQAGEGLFVIDDDLARVAAGIREQGPMALLVDDAHLRPGFLKRLRHLRQEVGASFRIIADCWPGERDLVARELGVTPSAVRLIDLLRRSQIVEIIRDCGIAGPNGLLHELVDQAAGKAGLAVTLCHLCLREGAREIVLADALARDVRATFEQLVGAKAIPVLAAFATGGERGLPMATVARELAMSLASIQADSVRLAAGGVLDQIGPGVLAVRPEALRHALVRDVFFRGPATLPIGCLLTAGEPDAVARTLIGARRRGARVEYPLLTDWLRRTTSDETWAAFAWLGPAESRWVLREEPGRLMAVARATLHHVPDEVIPLLLDAEAREERPGASTSEGPLGTLRAWVAAAHPGTGEPVRRREALLRAALAWAGRGESWTVGLAAACTALTPAFIDYEHSPADRFGLTMLHGCITPEEMLAAQGLWPRLRERLAEFGVEDWSPLKALAEEWAYPGRMTVQLSPEVVGKMAGFVAQVLEEITRLGQDRPSLLHWALRLAHYQGLQLPVQLDPDFLTLFPFRELGDWHSAQEEQAGAARELAARWVSAPPEEVARRLAAWDLEMRGPEGRLWPCWSDFVCGEIARRSDAPSAWVNALRDAGAAADLIEPFLRRAAELSEPGWCERLEACLDDASLQAAAVGVVLQLAEPPPGLIDRALRCPAGLPAVALSLCIRGSISEDRVRLLLEHEDGAVASSAATGEWYADPAGSVRPGLRAAWRRAVVRCMDEPHGGMLRLDADLARDWLASRLWDPTLYLWERGPAREALEMLSTAQRVDLLRQAPDDVFGGEAVRWIVGDDLAVYSQLLADKRHHRHHLAPLCGRPDDAWAAKALLALGTGYVPEEVALAAHRRLASWGSESDLWAELASLFQALASHPDARIRQVAQIGREDAMARSEVARLRERREAVLGDS